MATAQDTFGQKPMPSVSNPLEIDDSFMISSDAVREPEPQPSGGGRTATNIPLIIILVVLGIIGLVVSQTLEVQRSQEQAQYVETSSRLLML